MSCNDELRPCYEDLIQKGNRLVDALSEDQLVNIVGASKLKRKVKQEISFLTKVTFVLSIFSISTASEIPFFLAH